MYHSAASIIISLVVGYFLHPWMENHFKRAGLSRTNYRGKKVAPSLGPVLLFSYVPAVAILLTGREIPGLWEATIAVLGMGFAGLVDDLFEEGVRGYRGHLLSWKEGTLTSGMLKAWWGIVLGLLLVPPLVTTPWELVAGLLAFLFWSNGLNQLDRRPGRALKGYFIFWLLLFIPRGITVDTLILLPMTALLLVLLPADLSERSMLGDAGSNALGAALGIYAVQVLPLNVLLWWMAAGALLNLVGERYSLTMLIEKNVLLKFLDRLGRDNL